MPSTRVSVLAVLALVTLTQLSCDTKKPTEPDDPITISNVLIVGGNGQSGITGSALINAITVEVRGSNGSAFANATVALAPSHGGTTSPSFLVTGVDGRANTVWTVGATAGTHTLTASVGTLQAIAVATVTAPAIPVVTVVVSPVTVDLRAVGATRQLSASALAADATPVVPQPAFTWTSSDPTKATVSTSGLVTALATGSTTISALASGKTGTRTVNVTQVITKVTATASATLTTLTDSVALTAQAFDSLNVVVAGAPLTWSTTDSTIAKVTAAGKVYAISNGSTRVRATAANAVFDSTMVVVALPTPSAPVVTATVVTATTISLAWADLSNETAYEVVRCVGVSCSNFVARKTLPANVLSMVDTVQTDSTYSYKVRGMNNAIAGTYSSIATAATLVPLAPTVTVTLLSASTATVSWNNVANETGYEIQRCTGASCSSFAFLAGVSANVITFADAGLGGALYSYRVRAENGPLVGAFSNTATVSTLAPGTPSLVASQSSTSQINLTWGDVANEANYRLESCAGVSCSSFAFVTNVSANATSYNVTGLGSNSFTYRLRAENGPITGAYSNTATANTFLPANVVVTATTAGTTQINLSWPDVANETQYWVDRCSGVSCASFASVATLPAGTTTFNNSGLSTNTSYSYRVRAINGILAGPLSNTATANTFIPGTPVLNVVPNNTSTNALFWGDVANETSYDLEYCEGDGCNPTTSLGPLSINTASFDHNGRATETKYRYRLTGRNGVISGASSNIVDVITIGLAPNGTCYLVACSSGISAGVNEQLFFYVDVPAGSDSLIVQVAPGTGDADLMVAFGTMPRTPGAGVSYSANGDGQSDRISVPAPAAGRWYINVPAYTAFSGWQIHNTPVKLLQDWSFESAFTYWTYSGSAFPFTGGGPRSGVVNTMLGVNGSATPVNTDGTVYQNLVVPSTAGAVTAEFYYRITTDEDKIVNSAYDYFYIRVRSTSGTLLSTRATLSNSNYSGAYARGTVDLTPWRGQTIRLSFENDNDSSNPSVMRLDDVWMYWTTIR